MSINGGTKPDSCLLCGDCAKPCKGPGTWDRGDSYDYSHAPGTLYICELLHSPHFTDVGVEDSPFALPNASAKPITFLSGPSLTALLKAILSTFLATEILPVLQFKPSYLHHEPFLHPLRGAHKKEALFLTFEYP